MALEISPQKTRVGWIGTGVMGRSMCGHVIDAGYKATVYSRTKSKADELVAKGARWADTPHASGCSFRCGVFDCRLSGRRPRGAARRHGCARALKSGGVLVDMTTSRPSLAVEIAEAAAKKGVVSIDAPVSGGDVGAKNGTLSIMIGGDAVTVAALEPLWKTMGSKWVLQGGPGAGQHTKVVNQTLIASGMIGVCEALLVRVQGGSQFRNVCSNRSPRVLRAVGRSRTTAHE